VGIFLVGPVVFEREKGGGRGVRKVPPDENIAVKPSPDETIILDGISKDGK
jgi:hypothetical protein